MERYLNRSSNWESLTLETKVRLVTGDQKISARGHLIYVSGENIELGFARPYGKILGDLYVTPQQLVYWGVNTAPSVFDYDESVKLSELMPLPVPAWNPRDLLPFPISGRAQGFLIDNVAEKDGVTFVEGHTGASRHVLVLEPSRGTIIRETVYRSEQPPIYKTYSKQYSVSGWPVPGKVVCRDSLSETIMQWNLSDPNFHGLPFAYENEHQDMRTSP